jgi:GLPGLI family protein
MKPLKFAFVLSCAYMSLQNVVLAQKKVSELTVVYDYAVTSNDASKASNDAATNTIYIKGNLVRSEISNSLFSSSTIYDSKTGQAILLKEVSGQKLLIRLTQANWADMNKYYDGIIFTSTSETKTIAGYKCIKAVGKTKNGPDIIVYYTTEIVPDNKNYNPKFRNLEGLPLEYELTNGSFKIQYTVSKINLNPVPASTFDIPKSGYREMTYDESKKLKS